MTDIATITFDKTFYNTIKLLNSFIKPYFLEVHKGIRFTVSPKCENTIKCEVNFGRHKIQWIQSNVEVTGIKEETNFTFNIQVLEKYGKLDKELKLLINLDKGKVAIESEGFKFRLYEQAEEPDMSDLPIYDRTKPSEDTVQLFHNLYGQTLQKENLITLQEDYTYEKLTDFLYRIEPKDTDKEFCMSYEDLKLIDYFIGNNKTASFDVCPAWYCIEGESCKLYIMKYAPDTLNKPLLRKRTDFDKTKVVNACKIEVATLKKLLKLLNVQKTKFFGLKLSDNAYICGSEGVGYKINAQVNNKSMILHILNQEFRLTMAEFNFIFKGIDKKEEYLTLVADRDFLIINKKFYLLMRSAYND